MRPAAQRSNGACSGGSRGGGRRRRTPAARAGKCTAAARANAARAPPRCLAICFWALDGPVCMIGLAVFWCGRPMVPVPVAFPRREVRTARCPGRAVRLLEHRCRTRVCSTCRVTRTEKKTKTNEKHFLQRMFFGFFPWIQYVEKKIGNTWGHLVQNLKLTGSCGQLGPWWRCAGRLCARDACSLASSVSGFGCRQRAATAPRRSRATCAAARTRLRTSRCENASARYRNARTLQGPPSPPLPLPSCSFLPCATASCSRGLCAGARRAAERAA